MHDRRRVMVEVAFATSTTALPGG